MDDLRIDKRTLQEGLPKEASLADVSRILQRLQKGSPVEPPHLYTSYRDSFRENLLASFIISRKSTQQRLLYSLKGTFLDEVNLTIFMGPPGLISVTYVDLPLLRGALSLNLPLAVGDSLEIFASDGELTEATLTLECS
jgi:hypothetical protein